MDYLANAIWLFKYYKSLGEKAMAQVDEDQINVQLNEDSNSIALIVKHLSGNMQSRWTHFLSEDGEKPWRNRDDEFDGGYPSKAAMLEAWEAGWACLLGALEGLTEGDFARLIYIRNEGFTVMEAINRQLGHYPYHVGQIVFLAKLLKKDAWQTPSIAKNKSQVYNQKQFERPAARKEFDDKTFFDRQE